MTFESIQQRILEVVRGAGIEAAERLICEWRRDPTKSAREIAMINCFYGALLHRYHPRRIPEAAQLCEDALEALEGDRLAQMGVLNTSIAIYTTLGDQQLASRISARAITLLGEPDTGPLRGRVFLGLANLERFYENWQAALEYARTANSLHRIPGYGPYDERDRICMLTLGLACLGTTHIDSGNWPLALSVIEECDGLPRTSSYSAVIVFRATLALEQADWRGFEQWSSEFESATHRSVPQEIDMARLRARACMDLGAPNEALILLAEAEAKAKELGMTRRIKEIQCTRSNILMKGRLL